MIIVHRARPVAFVLAVLLASVATTACSNKATVDAQAARTAATDSVTQGALQADAAVVADTLAATTDSTRVSASTATVSGTLEPQSRALLRAELSGAVRTLPAKVGERVAAGQVLATLDVPAVRSAMAAADAQVMAQEVAMRQVERERERVAQLLAVGGVSRTEMDDWDSRVQAADAALQAARAQRATAAADVARLTVRAPFAGIVERRIATQGSVVQAGDELVSVIDSRTLEFEAGVAITQAHLARPEHRVLLRVAGYPDEPVVARIARVAPSLDPVTRQLRITVNVPNGAGRIPAGAWAEGTLLGDDADARTPSRVASRRR